MQPKPPPIEAALFDLDDTLIMTEDVLDEAVVEVFKRDFNIDVSDEMVDKLRGCLDVGPGSWTSKCIEEYNLKMTESELSELVYKECDAHMANAAPTKGAYELVSHCRRIGLKCAVVTSSTIASAQAKLKAHEDTILAHMTDVICVDDCLPHPKPHPRPYLLAAERLGVPIERCLVFEDSLPGIRSGVAAGATVIAVPAPDFRERARELGPYAILPSLADFDLDAFMESRRSQSKQ